MTDFFLALTVFKAYIAFAFSVVVLLEARATENNGAFSVAFAFFIFSHLKPIYLQKNS